VNVKITIMKLLALGIAGSFVVWTALSAQQTGPLFGTEKNTNAPAVQKEEEKPMEDDSPIKVNVNLVNVMASVRDKHNGLIPDLTKDDFEIYENGQLQTIKYFSRETNLPLTIGLLIDVSASQGNLIEIERSAGSTFLDSVLKPKDEAFIISFGADSDLLQDITSSKRLLHEGLRALKPNFGFGGLTAGPVPTANHQAGTVLYDALYLAATDRLTHEVGRKAIVVITDGNDEGSRTPMKQAVEYAQKADATIHSVYYVDPYFYSRGGFGFGAGAGRGVLKDMSSETGGHVYEVDRKNTLEKVFAELQDEMRTQYAIGYTPTDARKDGSYRKLEVKVKNKDYKVEARKGYYAVPQQAE
jgi:VWFA-related protein